ncbi:hypothetical protein AK88_04203 [Plasmodium fragile]|uniref:CPW-WPC domain-containing protein n=1 Tax=Plasmodium fragile TaxID=5857 RepID=A0A0D9QH91_PLAFR|nr:uncharacterized protein AK88_04203 [Plasmodium fragile]KJP86152.1 hypothetical protein AK88_04203 [Plasmodium fragile]
MKKEGGWHQVNASQEPCLDQCERNYSLQCPEQWAPQDDKTCRPLAIYEGVCLPSHDFSNMTDAQKEIWSNKCGTDWPCMVRHTSLYSTWGMPLSGKKECHTSDCFLSPHVFPSRRARRTTLEGGWTKESNTQRSSNHSPFELGIFFFSTWIAIVFFTTMNDNCPILGRTILFSPFFAIRLQQPCPAGWLVKSDAFGNAISCLPPDNYTGPCGEETKLMAANPINYDQLCPDGWTKSEQYCVAPQNYMGPCAKKKLFASFERGMKRAYAEECDVEWPFVGREASDSYPKGSALRKRKYNIGPVEPFTGAIISGTVK